MVEESDRSQNCKTSWFVKGQVRKILISQASYHFIGPQGPQLARIFLYVVLSSLFSWLSEEENLSEPRESGDFAKKGDIMSVAPLKKGKYFSSAATVVDFASYWLTYPALLFASETLSSIYVAR